MEANFGGYKMKKPFLLMTFHVLLLIPTVLAEPKYELIDLGALPGGFFSLAESINNNGQVVGQSDNASWFSRAILFDSSGGGINIDLGTLGGDTSYASSINDNGQIVGGSDNASGEQHATLFDSSEGGNNIDLGLLPGGNESNASSINNNGQIVGYARNPAGEQRATLFDSSGDGNNIDLGILPDGNESIASSINNNGQIVGFAKNSAGEYRAVFFDPTGDGNNIDLGTLGGNYSYNSSINDNGQIVGDSNNAAGFSRATLFDPTGNGNNIDLGTLPGGSTSGAQSINNKGQIVGLAKNSEGEFRAVIFDPTGNGNNIDLNTLIDPALGWELIIAKSINDNGWIVGLGENPNGNVRAFLLIPINTTPIAVAGPNQVVYVCDRDGFADVTLDGSASYDDDNDILDYYWSWFVDDNLYEANGVSPTIQLPVGEYEIELVVDDGIDLSEPNYCTITVVEPLHAKMLCIPSFINTQSRGGIITAFVYMPDGITPEDINDNEPLEFICDSNAVESTRQFVFEWNMHGRSRTWVIASFDKGDCLDILSPGYNRIKVAGRLNSGRCYYGNCCIYVYKPRPFRRFWSKPRH
jgi:probable HAF family extracellular repeat protein